MGITINGSYMTATVASYQFDLSATGIIVLASSTVVLVMSILSPATNQIVGMTGGEDGRIVILVNDGRSYDIDAVNESVSDPTASNRFAGGFSTGPDEARAVIYDGTSSRWRLWM